jgi:excinuclease ABC subunit C
MLREVIRRRYLRLIQDNSALPDLILIDGGKGHLLAAADEITQLGIKIPLISIAKERENIYTTGRINALKLRPDSAALNLIRRIRDEAHRFALAYHHVLRRKKIIGK